MAFEFISITTTVVSIIIIFSVHFYISISSKSGEDEIGSDF